MSIGDGIGKRIKGAREARNMSKSALAKAVGYTTTAVWNWEENQIAPRHETLIRVAETLGVSYDFLKFGKDNTSSAPVTSPSAKTPSVSEIVEDAKARIAQLTGFDITHVKLHLELLAD